MGFNGDSSFRATLRAILAPRVGSDDKVGLTYTHSTYAADSIRSSNPKDVFRACLGGVESNRLYIHNAHATIDTSRKALFDAIDDPEKGFVKQFPSFVELTAPRKFVEQKGIGNMRFFSSDEMKTSVVFVEMLNIKLWHLLQCFVYALFKWYFVDKPISPEEKELMSSLAKKSSTEYEELIEAEAAKYDFRGKLIEKVVARFESESRRAQLAAVNDNISNTETDARNTLERYQNLIEALDQLRIRRYGLQAIIDSGDIDSELSEYFQSHKMLDPIGANGSKLEFIVRTYLDGYDPEMYASIARNRRSYMYNNYEVSDKFSDVENRKKLLDAIFSDDPVIRVKMCAYYSIDTRGSVDSMRGYSFPRNCQDYIPNPHLHYHDCLGDHQRYISERLLEGDTIGAIEQCIASSKSINVGEDITVKYFLQDLFTSKNKVIELSDGRNVTPSEALDWLNEQEA